MAMVLRRHTVPSDTDIRSFLAWFYDAMQYSTQEPVDISLPLSLINTNEVYVIDTHHIRKVAFVVPFLGRYESRPWEIKKSFHRVEAVNTDKWTRYDHSHLPGSLYFDNDNGTAFNAPFRFTILPRTPDAGTSVLNIIGRFSLPVLDGVKAFRAFLPQVCRLTEGGALPFSM
jgi:hypothetical protein